MQENPHVSEIDGPSFVGKIHSTKQKLRNWERISRVELFESRVTFNKQTIHINTMHTDYLSCISGAMPPSVIEQQSHSHDPSSHSLYEFMHTHSHHCIFTDHKSIFL